MNACFLARDLLRHLLLFRSARFEHAGDGRVEDTLRERLPPLRLPISCGVLGRQGFTVDVVEVMDDQDGFEKIVVRLDLERGYFPERIASRYRAVFRPRIFR